MQAYELTTNMSNHRLTIPEFYRRRISSHNTVGIIMLVNETDAEQQAAKWRLAHIKGQEARK